MSRNETERIWTVLGMIKWGTDYFNEKEIPDPRLSMEWLLADLLSLKRLDLYLQFDRPLSGDELQRIKPHIKRRAAGEPLQYITGTADFMDVTLHVNPSVLIPRMETEQLVDLLLEETRERKGAALRLLDLGTGSGCIPVSVKKSRPDWYCRGTDISQKAVETAELNAASNGVDVDFLRQEFQETFAQKEQAWDIIISNPPYITSPEKSRMHRQVVDFEPHLALFHEDPPGLYHSIIRFARSCNAQLFLECNDLTAAQIANIASGYYSDTQLRDDLNGLPRFVICTP